MQVRWKKSTYSGSQSNCVEVAHTKTAIRDSKHTAGPALVMTSSAIKAFLDSVRTGRFDQ